MLSVITIIAAAQVAAGPCGDSYICPVGGNSVCGVDRDGKLTTRNNKCEAYCKGEEIERQGKCLADIVAHHEECKKIEKRDKCEASQGCRFDELYVQDTPQVPAGIACSLLSGNTTGCNGKRDAVGNRQCTAVTRLSDFGDSQDCIEFEICASVSAEGMDACTKVVNEAGERICQVKGANDGKCMSGDIPAKLLQDVTDETNCGYIDNAKWISYFTCSPKSGQGPGAEDAENGVDDLEQQCDRASSPDDCKNLVDDITGNKACNLILLGGGGLCVADLEVVNEDDEDFLSISALCVNITDHGGSAADCNAVGSCKFQEVEASGSFMCTLHDTCRDIKNDIACSGSCQW
jgi:hypothetical protein